MHRAPHDHMADMRTKKGELLGRDVVKVVHGKMLRGSKGACGRPTTGISHFTTPSEELTGLIILQSEVCVAV